MAIGEADVIVFMVDVQNGINAGDHEVAEILRRADKPTILVANKADSAARRESVYEFYELGLGEPIADFVLPRNWNGRFARSHRGGAAGRRGRHRAGRASDCHRGPTKRWQEPAA